ncbi:stalk domain-containing protein [Cohnella silvisoli]|uniref:Stalk domain-containing protein n=1 Tax=Cohnella silvisoli TaxID=2873699 RepID=A0ABV1KY78_9BACL|nr:stalk domain-containing protein [Cohnella silvisoli]MCD9021819.1 hypothetical protein [Cohnella silvisoli]
METSNFRVWKVILALLIGLGIMHPLLAKAEGTPPLTQTANHLLSNVEQIEAGDTSGFAVKTDGTLWAWGGGQGSLGNGTTMPAYTPVKVHIDHVKQVSSGYRSTLMLRTDGTVWSVGGNEHGQLGNGKQSTDIAVEPHQVVGLTDIIAVSAGDMHSLALQRDGTVWAWGGNGLGQIGNGTLKNALSPVKVDGLPTIVAIAAGKYTSLALGNGGEVWVWGLKQYKGSNMHEIRKPTQLAGSGEYKALAIEDDEAAALQWDGTVWTWNNYTPFSSEATLVRKQVTGLTDIVSVSFRSAVKADGTVWVWSKNSKEEWIASQIKGINDAIAITRGTRNQYVLLKDGHVLSWGTNEFGQTGLGFTNSAFELPTLINNSVTVTIDGKETEMLVSPLIVNQVTFVPLRGVLEKLGVQVEWDVKTRSILATKGDIHIVINSLTGQTTVNGKVVPSEEKPLYVNGSILVPLRIIGETVGADVKWDAPNYSVRITQ